MYQALFQKCWDVVEDKPSPSPHGVYIPVSHRVRSTMGEKNHVKGSDSGWKKTVLHRVSGKIFSER